MTLKMPDLTDNCEKNAQTEGGRITDKELPLGFTEDRHLESIEGIDWKTQTWRMKERMKTVGLGLVLCLNIGVDPPDVVKTQPCARLECWIDPLSMSGSKALEEIGQALQSQYGRWQSKQAKYKYRQCLDPTSDEVKKLCLSLRRYANKERVLFHYNGHGVPKPTVNGEIWVFNRTFTQYIPLSIYDLQTWMGAPSIYVYDCSNAGIIVDSFKAFALQHESEFEQTLSTGSQRDSISAPPSYKHCIQLAACGPSQNLPMNPDLPADLFTSCLTTPLKIALRWFVLQSTSKLVPNVTLDLVDKVPGKISERRTMLGELNWIFTAITDTIAWNTLPRELFQKLFRQDLLVASLFRNFLLAERIMRSCDCTPISNPALPSTYQHPMWNAWDLVLDLCLGQLPNILENDAEFQHLPFFEEQLTAFQVWLDLGSEERNPPEQLPIVLQVLLSQMHRIRALELLGRFLDLGPWAVNLALSVGIFPYVLKLLQSFAKELRPLLVYIWAKILAVDNTCQADLVRENGHKYFLSILQDSTISSESRTQATFVLSCLVTNFRDGQEAALQGSLVSICLEQLSDPSPHLRQWVAICLGKLWDHYENARWTGVRDIAHDKLYTLLEDPCPEVRAAAVYALGTFINSVSVRSIHANNIDLSIVMTLVNNVSGDMSPLVRKELINALQWVILVFDCIFVNVASQEHIMSPVDAIASPTGFIRDRLRPNEDLSGQFRRIPSSPSIHTIASGGSGTMNQAHSGSLGTLPGLGYGSIYMKIWAALCALETDPHPEVSQMCCTVTGYIRTMVKEQREQQQTESRCGTDNRPANSSMSLPPSPNRSSFLSGESPPTLHPNGDFQKLAKSAIVQRSKRQKNDSDKRMEKSLEDHEKLRLPRKPLVQTNFVLWSSKQFVQSKKKKTYTDTESRPYYERDWRCTRNANIRCEAFEEQKRAITSRIESQLFHTRTIVPPSLLQLHPFSQQIAVAGNDSFAIWDWGTGAKTTVCQNKSFKQAYSKVTALEWINGHDIAMLMVASDDGSIKLWRPNTGVSREPSLITAWQAFTNFKIKNSGNQTTKNKGSTTKKHCCLYCRSFCTKLARHLERRHSDEQLVKDALKVSKGVILSWEQWTQTVITTGDSRVLRFWDAERELKAFDIPTGTDASVTAIDSTYSGVSHETYRRCAYDDDLNDDGLAVEHSSRLGLAVAGCSDGSVRLFDRRCNPADARVKLWMEHTGSVLGVQLRGDTVISGSSDGDVKVYDIRQNDSLKTTKVAPNGGISCVSIHRNADTYACGSVNQFISIYSLNGSLLNTIRFYEGFMGQRIGPINCLNFHPHKAQSQYFGSRNMNNKNNNRSEDPLISSVESYLAMTMHVVLAAGTSDCCVNVYGVEPRR